MLEIIHKFRNYRNSLFPYYSKKRAVLVRESGIRRPDLMQSEAKLTLYNEN